MILTDVNVLVYAYREDAPGHAGYRQWLEDLINSNQAYGVSDLVLSGFLRVVTHPRVFNPPSDLARALAFVRQIREQPNAVNIAPGPRHWDIFKSLCEAAGVKGNLVPDAIFGSPSNRIGQRVGYNRPGLQPFPGLEVAASAGKLTRCDTLMKVRRTFEGGGGAMRWTDKQDLVYNWCILHLEAIDGRYGSETNLLEDATNPGDPKESRRPWCQRIRTYPPRDRQRITRCCSRLLSRP